MTPIKLVHENIAQVLQIWPEILLFLTNIPALEFLLVVSSSVLKLWIIRKLLHASCWGPSEPETFYDALWKFFLVLLLAALYGLQTFRSYQEYRCSQIPHWWLVIHKNGFAWFRQTKIVAVQIFINGLSKIETLMGICYKKNFYEKMYKLRQHSDTRSCVPLLQPKHYIL